MSLQYARTYDHPGLTALLRPHSGQPGTIDVLLTQIFGMTSCRFSMRVEWARRRPIVGQTAGVVGEERQAIPKARVAVASASLGALMIGILGGKSGADLGGEAKRAWAR